MAIENEYMSRTEACRKLRLSKDQMVRRIRRGEVNAIKVGYNWLIPVSEIKRIRTLDWYKASVKQPENAL